MATNAFEEKLEKILRYGVYLVALVPLIIFSQFLSPFHFGKVVVFRSWIELVSVLYLVLIMKNRKFLPKPGLVFWSVTAFTAVFGITTLTSVNFYQSMMGTLERMGGWFSFLHYWLFFIIAASILRKQEDWLQLLKISAAASLISALYGFLQRSDVQFILGSGGRTRIFGTIGNPALFAGYEIVNAFFALFLFLYSKTKYVGKVFYGLIFIIDFIAILMTAVRGSVLAIVAATGLFFVLYSFIGGSKKIRYAMGAAVTILIVFELLIVVNRESNFVKNSGYLSRLSDVSFGTRTVDTRLWAWQAGIKGWREGPKTILFGWGPENFNIPFSKYFNPKFFDGPGAETLFDRAHNMFIEILVTMGILGFLSYISIFAVLFWGLIKIYKKSRDPDHKLFAVCFISGLVAYAIHNSFIFDISANLIAFFMAIGVVNFEMSEVIKEPRDERPAVQTKKSPGNTLVFSSSFVLLILVFISIYKTNIKPVLANYATTRGIIASWSNNNELALEKFNEALSYDTFGEYEIRNRYAQYVLENLSKFKGSQTEILLSAIEAVKLNLAYKEDYLPYLYISRAYILLGKDDPASSYNDLALQNSMAALKISPTFVRTYFEIAQAYLNKKDLKNAIVFFQRAVILNPDVGISWWYLGVTQLQAGDEKNGLSSIDHALARGFSYDTSEADLQRLVGIYNTHNDFGKIAVFYQKLTLIRPKNPQYHASLAATYAKLGKIDEAVTEAKIAAGLDPSFLPEARSFVERLGRQF